MKNIISMGINMGHDRGAAIVKDGILIGALAQERIDRIKHSSSLEIPFDAINVLLDYLHITINDISNIGISCTSVDIPNLYRYCKDILKQHYNICIDDIVPVSHHLAHAESCFNTSDFNDALIFIADGGGDVVGELEESETLFSAENDTIELLERRLQSNYIHAFTRPQMYNYPFMNAAFRNAPISLGKKYGQLTALLGFGPYGAGKTMGLASYGKNMIEFSRPYMSSLQFKLNFFDILDQIYDFYLKSELPYYSFISENRANIAQTGQFYIEEQTCALINYIINTYKPHNLCLAGGIFLNCPLNHKIITEHPDVNVHICPAAGDEGQAIGAAFAAYKKLSSPIYRSSNVLPYLGPHYNRMEIENAINQKGLRYDILSNEQLITQIAQEVYKNHIVGVLHGRSENGPRALCHRSILANPCNADMKDYINQYVKHRENFRPFAPSVIEEKQYEIFNLKKDSPYMLLSAKVKDNYRKMLPAITHVDGTARVQSISKKNNLLIHNVLTEFEKLSGIPVILNTSFNDNNEPIVETPDNAINTYLNTNIDILFIENYKIYK